MVIFIIFGFILGACLGSFIKAIAERSLREITFWGRSKCDKCKKVIKPYDLIPIASYFILQGKCRYCHHKLGRSYFLTEISFGILVALLFWKSFLSFPGIESTPSLIIFIFNLGFNVFFVTVLGILFLTDLKEMLIPDSVVLPAILIAFFAQLGILIYKVYWLYRYLASTYLGQALLTTNDFFVRHTLSLSQPFLWSIASAVIIGGFFLILVLVTKGKGMGGGDIRLGAFIGMCLGFPASFLAIFLSFVIGAVVSIFLVIFGKKHFKEAVPFGPFMVVGSLIALFWGNEIMNWYLRLN